METLKVNKPFSHTLKLIREASSQDVMLINETSPCMVRFLSKDNRFRTFVITEEGDSIVLRATKSDDKKEQLKDFSEFLYERDGDLEKKKKEEVRAKQKAAKEKREAEEAFQKRTKAITIEKSDSDNLSFVDRKKLEEEKASKEKKSSKSSKKKTTKKKSSKKKTTKKKKSSKKK